MTSFENIVDVRTRGKVKIVIIEKVSVQDLSMTDEAHVLYVFVAVAFYSKGL